MFSAKTTVLFLIPIIAFSLTALASATELSQCALCHTNPDMIDELTEDAITYGEASPEISPLQKGNGYQVKQAPFDLYEKVLVKESFLESPHGGIPCQLCHLGDPNSTDPEIAHAGMRKDPSFNSRETCGQCHTDITTGAVTSLHMDPAPLYATLKKRCSKGQMETLENTVLQGQCLSCHLGSCGSCHVSRPNITGGGLRDGHNFTKKPDFVFQCLPCHSHPMGSDFTGKQDNGDVHYRKYKMTCTNCHSGQELHASANGAESRYHFDQLPRCIDCHDGIPNDSIPEHVLHKTVSCSVCHAGPYQNCNSCHVGTDEDGIPYSRSPQATKNYKIGLNPDKKGPRFVLMREVGVHRDTFKEDIGKMAKFSTVPTYKRATPHTIQRRTWQAANCNHCHGNKELFLTQDSVPFDSIVANRHVLLKPTDLPGTVQTKRSYVLTPTNPDTAMRVSAQWLKKHGKDKNIIILDTRTKEQYEAGHIPGAYHLCFCLFRTSADSTPPYMMQTVQDLAKVFSGTRFGLTPGKRVVLYDDGHSGRGITFLALKMIGHKNVSFLDGNLAAWETQDYALVKGKAPKAKPTNYPVKANKLLVNNSEIVKALGTSAGLVVDVRNAAQHNGDMNRSDIAKKGGAIPDSLSFPLQTVFDSEGKVYPDGRLAWLLSSAGINQSKNKEIITTCNTNMLAAELYMILTYLGYDNVKVHDGSWAEWSAEFE